jgi:TetR/AcrR family transcriptional repressor of nem operon
MPQNETIRDAILDAAEGRARAAGYNGFSFRDLASDVGIKSASVHYHFPTKGDLAHELMERYRIRALEALGSPKAPESAVAELIALFRTAATGQEMCLCGALGVTSAALPEPVQLSATRFSYALVAWLKEAPGWERALPLPPETIVSLLEGALLLSVTARDPDFFEMAVDPLLPQEKAS